MPQSKLFCARSGPNLHFDIRLRPFFEHLHGQARHSLSKSKA